VNLYKINFDEQIFKQSYPGRKKIEEDNHWYVKHQKAEAPSLRVPQT
jgi:hypothetical protein